MTALWYDTIEREKNLRAVVAELKQEVVNQTCPRPIISHPNTNACLTWLFEANMKEVKQRVCQ